MPTAILIDGGFFQKRYKKVFPGGMGHDPKTVAKAMFTMALKHIDKTSGEKLYRIFYYDCPPCTKKAMHPLTGKTTDFAATPRAKFQLEFFEELKKLRKLALRLGDLRDHGGWQIDKDKLKELLAKKITIDNLTPTDVYYDLVQKGVDMRIGLDIASLAYKKLVDKIVLVSGDSDFVPAAKLARREGIDFVLDPMWNHINPDLNEHIDGLQSQCPKPIQHTVAQKTVTTSPKPAVPNPALPSRAKP